MMIMLSRETRRARASSGVDLARVLFSISQKIAQTTTFVYISATLSMRLEAWRAAAPSGLLSAPPILANNKQRARNEIAKKDPI